MKKTILVLLFLGFLAGLGGLGSVLQAQHRLLRKANNHYDRLSYELAIPYYERYLKRFDDSEAVLKLADCYRLTHNYSQAARWYQRVMALTYQPPISYFYYGHALLQQGKYEQARDMFLQYSLLEPTDPRGQNFVDALDRHASMLRDSGRVELFPMPFNSKAAEFGAWPYQDGVIFASSRDVGPPVIQDFNWLDHPFLSFFFSRPRKDSVGWTKPELLKGEANSRYHESNFTMSQDSGTFYFTRNNFSNKKRGKSEAGIIKLKIYKGNIEGLNVSNVEEFPWNDDDYSVTHPSISADGRTLYFVSDKPGGEGGKDVYVCRKEGSGWSQPKNLRAINTPGDEAFPFIHPDGTLYFASDGHPGLGHLDIFYVKLQGKQQVVNMGYPINTAYDDFAFYFAEDRESGYFSSDRPGGAGNDDIYAFTMERPVLEIYVLDSVAQLPLENAQVDLRDMTEDVDVRMVTDSMGRVAIKTDFGHDFRARITTEEFPPKNVKMNTDPGRGQLVYTYIVELKNPPPAITGIVIDDSTKERLPGATVEFIDLRMRDTLTRIADRNGRFAIALAPQTYYEINVRQRGYLTYSERVSTTLRTFEGDTVIPLKMEPIPFNKPIVLENIHYDFDQWTIRYDAYNDLIYLANLIKKNPGIIVELGSHTDCRGSDAYNERLSQRRANAARYFIVDLGVDPKRIVARGYGEYQLSNECDDHVYCTEEKHFANRRTEFKIIGTIDGIDVENSVLATDESKGPPPSATTTGPGGRIVGARKPPRKPVVVPKPVIKSEPVVRKEDPPVNVAKVADTKEVEASSDSETAPDEPVEAVMLPGTEEDRIPETDPEPIATVERFEPGRSEELDKEEPVDPENWVNGSADSEPEKAPPAQPEEQPEEKPEEKPEVELEVEPEVEPEVKPDVKPEAPAPPVVVVETPPVESEDSEADALPVPSEESEADTPPEKPEETDVETVRVDDATRDDPVSRYTGDITPAESISPTSTEADFILPDLKYDAMSNTSGMFTVFRIRIGAFAGYLSEESIAKLRFFVPYTFMLVQNRLKTYYIGEYYRYEDAAGALQQVKQCGYYGAYVTAFKQGKELNYGEFQRLIGQ